MRQPPQTVGELADALGLRVEDVVAAPMGDMGHIVLGQLMASYWWDMYHEDRVTTAERMATRRLRDWSFTFQDGRAECQDELRREHGEPVELDDKLRYGPQFFLIPFPDDGFRLSWYEQEPDWAKPPVDAERRRVELRELAARVAAAGSPEELAGALDEIPAGVGLKVAGPGWVRFDLPVPARDVTDAFGIADPAGASSDVHMSHWQVRARVGRWTVDINLSGWPSGDPGPDDPPGPFGPRPLGEDDTAYSLEIAQADTS